MRLKLRIISLLVILLSGCQSIENPLPKSVHLNLNPTQTPEFIQGIITAKINSFPNFVELKSVETLSPLPSIYAFRNNYSVDQHTLIDLHGFLATASASPQNYQAWLGKPDSPQLNFLGNTNLSEIGLCLTYKSPLDLDGQTQISLYSTDNQLVYQGEFKSIDTKIDQ